VLELRSLLTIEVEIEKPGGFVIEVFEAQRPGVPRGGGFQSAPVEPRSRYLLFVLITPVELDDAQRYPQIQKRRRTCYFQDWSDFINTL
jgi:hypothetical protein